MSAPQRYHLLRRPRFGGERRSALETTRIPDRRGNLQCLPRVMICRSMQAWKSALQLVPRYSDPRMARFGRWRRFRPPPVAQTEAIQFSEIWTAVVSAPQCI